MITVMHFMHNQVCVSGTVRRVDGPNQVAIECRYVVGDLPPRYPVPAIPITFIVGKSGRWAVLKNTATTSVYRWWHRRDNGEYGMG